jgi:hypothetical protein
MYHVVEDYKENHDLDLCQNQTHQLVDKRKFIFISNQGPSTAYNIFDKIVTDDRHEVLFFFFTTHSWLINNKA